MKSDTSLVTALILLVEAPQAAQAEVMAAVAMVAEVRSATSVEKSVTSPATVLKVVPEATVEVVTVGEQVTAAAADMEAAAHSKLVIPAAAMDTCLATVPRARNATTVGGLSPTPENC